MKNWHWRQRFLIFVMNVLLKSRGTILNKQHQVRVSTSSSEEIPANQSGEGLTVSLVGKPPPFLLGPHSFMHWAWTKLHGDWENHVNSEEAMSIQRRKCTRKNFNRTKTGWAFLMIRGGDVKKNLSLYHNSQYLVTWLHSAVIAAELSWFLGCAQRRFG